MKNLGRAQRWAGGSLVRAREALARRAAVWTEYGTGGMPRLFVDAFPSGLTGGCTRRTPAVTWFVAKSLRDGFWYAYGPSGGLRTKPSDVSTGRWRRFRTQETARAAVDKVIRAAEE